MKYYLILLICGWFPLYFAQSDVFETDGKGNRDIERAHRIASAPKIIDSIKTSAVPNRPLLGPKLTVNVSTDTIEAATIETEQLLEKLYPFYLKLGMGSTLMPMGEFYVNSTRSRANYYGLHVKHLSFLGDIKNREKQLMAPATFDHTSIQGNFETFQKSFTLQSYLKYTNHGFHYYGLNDPNADKDSIAQRYQLVNAHAAISSNRGDTGVFNLKTTLDFRYTGTDSPKVDSLNDWKSKEQGFKLNTLGTYKTGSSTIYGCLGLRYNGYSYGIQDSILSFSDSGFVNRNTVVDINPGVKSLLAENNLSIDAGFNVSIDVSEKTRAYFFPSVFMQFALMNNQFIPYISLKGQVKQASLTTFYQENQFILPNLNIQNQINPYDIQLGIKGAFFKKFTYGLQANFIKENNRAFFVTDTLISSGNKFTLVYDSLIHTRIEGQFGYQAGKKLSLDFITRYHSYELFNEARAWNLPQAEIILQVNYNLFDKLLVKAGLDMSFGRYAKVYKAGTNITELNNQFVYDLGNVFDGNLTLEYRYSKRISGFVQINNIASQRYLRFYNYPVIPISIFGGLTIKF